MTLVRCCVVPLSNHERDTRCSNATVAEIGTSWGLTLIIRDLLSRDGATRMKQKFLIPRWNALHLRVPC